MTIPAQCPVCSHSATVQAFVTQAQWQECLELALNCPPAIGALVLPYAQLFEPRKSSIQARKLKRILSEINQGITTGKIKRKGREWIAPTELWIYGLTKAINAGQDQSLDLPLESNAWLYEVMCRRASSTEAKEEAQANEQKRHIDRTSKKQHAQNQADIKHLETQLATVKKQLEKTPNELALIAAKNGLQRQLNNLGE